jgi:NRPS condensation-like uncharacterized protein
LKTALNAIQVEAGSLSVAMTTKLIDYCRQERTTVHAAISTALLLAIAIQDHFLNQNQAKTLKCFFPINLRPYLQQVSTQDCGSYIAPIQTTHNLTRESQFWEVARSLKTAMMAQTEIEQLRQLAQKHEILISAKPSPATVQQVFQKHYSSDLMVTNLGRLAIPQKFGNLRLRAIYGPIVLSGFAQERVLGVATLGEQLFFTFVQHKSLVSANLTEKLIQLLQTAIAIPDFNPLAVTELANF